MSFHSPHLLWLLVPLVLLFSWELARHTSRTGTAWPKISRAWAGAFQVSLGSAHTTAETRPRLWLWFGLALCLIALARPQWGTVEEKVFDQSREVLLALDLSRSMLTQDVKPSRLDRSKLLISSLLDGLKGERVGLVLFAGTSFLQSPLSSDYEVLREFLPALKPEYLPEGGSNYKAMLEAAIQSFGTSTADRYLIILSDGESTDENWKEMSDTLKTKGIRVIGLGVGTTQGGFIPDGSGGFVKDERGAVVLSRLNSSTLQELAQLSGGSYADASSWIDLSALLKQTVDAGKKGEFSEKSTARLLERFQWFLAPGLFILLISFWAEFPVRPRERALPLAGSAKLKAVNPKLQSVGISAACLLCMLSTLNSQLSAQSAESAQTSLAGPLTTTVTRLVAQDTLNPKDCSDLAETTITFGQRLKSSQQQPPEGVIRDALAAVDQGEQTDSKAADWPKLRKELEEFLKKEEPPKQDQKKDEQKKQDQKDKDQQKKDEQSKQDQQDKNPQDQKQKDQQEKQDQSKSDQQKQDQQKSEQQKKDEQQKDAQNQSEPKEDAFGDMKEKQPPAPKPEPPKQPPPSGTQKVGGQAEKKPDAPLDPELAVPLQKLEQVRNQDSPALLQQMMQGKPKTTKPPSKDW